LKVLRLYPPPGREISGIYENLTLPPSRHCGGGRPYVIVNMVSSVDGRTSMEGKAAGLGSRIDRETMRTLRSRADAVMIGAGTLRAEKLSLGLDETDGLQPLTIIVTHTGNIPLEEHLVATEEQEVLILLSDKAPQGATQRLREFAQVMKAPADSVGDIDLDRALRALKAERGIDVLVVEGGPGLNHGLISRNLVDELFLTVAPELLGGTATETLALLRGPEIPARDRPALDLESIHLADGELFLRYSLTRVSQNTS
jgi:riboflavin-specific deaminase-like protein